MAATITTAPTSPAYHRDNTFVVVATDQITVAPATVDLDIATGGPAIDDTFNLTWLDTTLQFTVAATTSDDALSIPVSDGIETLAEYAARVAEALRQNDILTADWLVQDLGPVGPDHRIRLVYRTSVALDVTTASTLANVTVATTDGEDPTAEANLAAYIQVFEAADDPNDDARIVSLHAPYDLDTAEAAFDLKDLIPLAPALPNRLTIDQVVALSWPHDEATGAWMKYYIRYAEKSGSPAVSTALLKSADYYMLHGSRRGNYVSGAGSLAAAKLLHAYLREDGVTFQKPLSDDQPDWVYIWTLQVITDCHVELQITWDNGDVTTEAGPGADFDLERYHAYWFSSGTAQIDLGSYTPPSGATEPVAYNWRLLGTYGLGEALIAQVRYRVACSCHPWNLYLLLDNGVGGCESVYIRGRVKTKYEANRDSARRQRWTDFSLDTGDLFNFNAEGQQVFEAVTGWHEKYYIEHLRQMMLGNTWIIDTANKRFLRVLCDTKTVELHEDDQQLYSLTFTLRAGWLDNNYHVNR